MLRNGGNHGINRGKLSALQSQVYSNFENLLDFAGSHTPCNIHEVQTNEFTASIGQESICLGIFNPSSRNQFFSVLGKCRKTKNLAFAKTVNTFVPNNRLEAHQTIGNHIVPMLIECGSVSDAQRVFDRLDHQNEHSWTSLISGYVACGQSNHALGLYLKMKADSIQPSCYTVKAILRACIRLKDMERGRQIHADIKSKGFDKDISIGNTLIHMYAKGSSLAEAREVFDSLPVTDTVSWNALIAGYVENGLACEALKCFEQMQLKGMTLDAVTFICNLKACGTIGTIDKGREIHTMIVIDRLESHLLVANTLIDMYSKCGSLAEAQDVFDKLPTRDVVTWNVLIAGYAENEFDQEGLKCFKEMQLQAITADIVTFVCILKACGNLGAIDKGREIHIATTEKCFDKHLSVGNSLIDMYAKCGSPSEAREVFDKLPVRDVVSWSALIAGYTDNGLCEEALICFEEMKLQSLPQDAVMFACSLKACGSIGAIEKGRLIHTDIARLGFENNQFVSSTLVDMYAKCGSLVEAQEVFDKLALKNVVSWTALIAGYAEYGFGLEALTCFDQMCLGEISPNALTFVSALKACIFVKSVEKGRAVHSIIVHRGLNEDVFIGNTLVDLYAKCGSLAEAKQVFDKLPHPDIVSWNSLITGYVESGLGQEALNCFQQMQQQNLSPDAVMLICMLKACGSIGAIDKGQEIHSVISNMGLRSDLFISSTLVDMYAKCGLLTDARTIFDKLHLQDVVSWNAMIRGYGMSGHSNMALECFTDMQELGIKPDATTFLCLLAACSRTNLVFEGHKYFRMMTEDYHIIPIIDHYTCMADLLARSGHLYEAGKLVENEIYLCSKELWTALLTASKTYRDNELGYKCFQRLVKIDPGNAVPYVLMADIYVGEKVEKLRVHV